MNWLSATAPSKVSDGRPRAVAQSDDDIAPSDAFDNGGAAGNGARASARSGGTTARRATGSRPDRGGGCDDLQAHLGRFSHRWAAGPVNEPVQSQVSRPGSAAGAAGNSLRAQG